MAKNFKTDTPTLAEMRRKKKPNRRKCEIVLDPEWGRLVTEKQNELDLAVRKAKSQTAQLGKSLAERNTVVELEAEIEALWAKADEEGAIGVFWFQDPGRKAYDDLVTANPPTKEQKEEWKEGGGEGVLAYNPETFVPALISLCADAPKIPLKEAEEICEEWGNGDITAMFFTAQQVCIERPTAPLSRRSLTDTDATSSSEPSSTSASE